ncbi:hypothetical protein [uncultured Clostridium sp.]|nr:hypothetical protein [uncultured Clostridium sp.]
MTEVGLSLKIIINEMYKWGVEYKENLIAK